MTNRFDTRCIGCPGKNKKHLKHFRVQAISLLRLRLEGLEATIVEGGKKASVLVLTTMELRPRIKVRVGWVANGVGDIPSASAQPTFLKL